MTVELDRRPGEETPRVTVKRVQPFETLASTTRMAMDIHVSDPAALAALGDELGEARGARGEVRLFAAWDDKAATVLLGRDFLLEGELAARIESLHGIARVELKTSETRLALVG